MKKIKDGVYFLCPECERFQKRFREVMEETILYEVEITNRSWEGRVERKQVGYYGGKYVQTQCPECDSFISDKWLATTFRVEVKKGKLFAYVHRGYWDLHRNKLKKIASKYNLEVEE